MYHAVMEEVARFLERCYQNIETITKNSQLARSRSVNHMFVDQSQPQPNQPLLQPTNGMVGNELNKNHHRNSTNSFDKSPSVSTTTTTTTMTLAMGSQQLNESFTSTSTSNTTNSNDAYNAFSDFTWWVWRSERWQIESNYNFRSDECRSAAHL